MLTIKRKKQYINRGVLYGAIALVVGMYPFRAFAVEPTSPATEQTTTTSPTSTPTNTPPATEQTTSSTTPAATEPAPAPQPAQTAPPPTATPPKEPEKNYYYDSDTKRWNTDEWKYDPISGTYKAVPPPAPKMSIPEKEAPESSTSSTIDSKTTAEIANALDSLAKTGDALVRSNTKAGSATSGDASATATIINNVNSSLTNATNTEAATFVSDVMGDVNGDIILQPMLLKAMLEANAATADETTINSANSTTITNDINLDAQSGDATVEKNTEAGNATTGTANTVADVVNIVNSMIAANQSFIGTVNIYGNLNGDILIAPDFLPKLLASNNGVSQSPDDSVTVVNATDTQSIVNNVALAAQSGQAVVEKNTSAGSATTGDAKTNLVLFNLTGHEVVAENSLLVFINVLGKWVGVIVDAPVGTTAAAIGSGVMKSEQSAAPSLAINAINDTAITNNINLHSQTGDALVRSNTEAGDATTGNATASANIANISNSQIGLSGWFGILFINVFGSWVGSFGVDTEAGERLSQITTGTKTRAAAPKQPISVLSYVPKEGSPQPTVVTTIVTPTEVTNQSQAEFARQVKAAQTLTPTSTIPAPMVSSPQSIDIPFALGSLFITIGSLYLLRRFIF